MKRPPHAFQASVVITISLMLAACGDSKQAAAPGGGAPPPFEVAVVTTSLANAAITKDLPGRLEARRTAQVRARVDGIIEKRLFTEGTDVREGAPLYQIDPRSYQTTFDAAQADVDIARLLLERYQPLLKIQAVSQQEYETAAAKLKQAQAALARAQIDLENARVPAPISGRISRSFVTEGALVGRAEATHLATIEQIDPLYANFTQPGTDFTTLQQAVKAGRLKAPASAQVELVLENGEIYSRPGKLLFSDLAVDPGTGAVSLRAQFPNPEHELLPGMFVRVRFPQATAEQVISLPQRAVLMGPTGQMVMVVDQAGKVTPRPVKIGGMSGSNWIISEGLAQGEQVMVEGIMKAPPGSTVKAVPWQPSAPPASNKPAGS